MTGEIQEVDVLSTLSTIELVWCVFNAVGFALALTTWLLARDDKRRLVESGRNGALHVLADGGEREELIRCLKHLGNFSVGVFAATAPQSRNENVEAAAVYGAVWLTFGALLLTFGTLTHLRSRYVFERYRADGTYGTYADFMRATLSEIRYVVARQFMSGGSMRKGTKRVVVSPDVTRAAERAPDDVVLIEMSEWKQAAIRATRATAPALVVLGGGGSAAQAATGSSLPPLLFVGLPSTGVFIADTAIILGVIWLVWFAWCVVEFTLDLDEKRPEIRA